MTVIAGLVPAIAAADGRGPGGGGDCRDKPGNDGEGFFSAPTDKT
jgi:hypothetical protein